VRAFLRSYTRGPTLGPVLDAHQPGLTASLGHPRRGGVLSKFSEIVLGPLHGLWHPPVYLVAIRRS
jgi:hypothetical protein